MVSNPTQWGLTMNMPSQPLSDPHIETVTLMSCKREPACFAFLGASAISAPVGIEQFNFDIVAADCHQGRPSVWATLEIRPDLAGAAPISLLGFGDGFLRAFARALIEAGSTRIAHRMRISSALDAADGPPLVVDYIRSLGGTRVRDLVITPYEQILAISTEDGDGEGESLFQMPRTDTFLKALARTAHLADTAMKQTLLEMERLGRQAQAPRLLSDGTAPDRDYSDR